MASTATPYGVRLISDQSGPTPRSNRMAAGNGFSPIASGYATHIFCNQPITLNNVTGQIQAVTSTTQPIWGIFAGVEYTPPGGRPTVNNWWPGGTVVDLGFDFFVYYYPAWVPSFRYKAQANGLVGQSAMGAQFVLTGLSAPGNTATDGSAPGGNVATGLSTCGLSAVPLAQGSQGQFTLTEFHNDSNSAIGDAFTDLICAMAFPQAGNGFQASIG